MKNGLNYKYYEGKWERLPNFQKLIPLRTGEVFNVALSEFQELANQFGIVFTGEIEIKHGGEYTFYLNSNDGSKLFINDKK